MLEDLFECSHAPEVPISDDGEIIAWYCRCGLEVSKGSETSMQGGAGLDPLKAG